MFNRIFIYDLGLFSEYVTASSARYSWFNMMAFLKIYMSGLNQKNTLRSSIKMMSKEWSWEIWLISCENSSFGIRPSLYSIEFT
jgi:hypothetical protein